MRKVCVCVALFLTWLSPCGDFPSATAKALNISEIKLLSYVPRESNSATSLKDALNDDGTLKAGLNGGFDAEGYSVSVNNYGKPVFLPFGTGDERWSSLPAYINLPPTSVYAVAQIGNDIFVGGAFSNIGGDVSKAYIARWDGAQWQSVGGGMNAQVLTIAVVGTNLYVGGDFTNAGGVTGTQLIAMWNGTQWYSVGNLLFKGGFNDRVRSLFVSGGDVYVAGLFGTTTGNNVLRWHPTAAPDVGTWNAIGGAFDNLYYIRSVFVQGSNVYITQEYSPTGVGLVAFVKMFNGTSWTQVGPEVNAVLRGVAFYSGKIYIGGEFTDASANPQADYIAVWNGTEWTDVAGGVNSNVLSLSIIGSKLYVSGNFTGTMSGSSAGLATWNGVTWEATGMDQTNVSCVSGTESNLLIGGGFQAAGSLVNANYFVRRVNGTLEQLSPSVPNGSYKIEVYNSEVYAITSPPAGQPNFMRFKNNTWQYVDATLNGQALNVHAANGLLYVSGLFTDAGGIANADYIATWNGTTWAAVAAAPAIGAASVSVFDVDGTKVYACFRSSTSADLGIYVLNGTTWSRLGTLTDLGGANDIEVIGSKVYVSSASNDMNGDPKADRLIHWDGAAWKAVGDGVNNYVNNLTIVDGKLCVLGGFLNVGGVAINDFLVMWDGTSWSTLGNGLGTGATLIGNPGSTSANYVAVSGKNLYVGLDYIDNIGGNPKALGIAVWNGIEWENLGSGLDAGVFDIVIDGQTVYAAGFFNGTKDKSVAAKSIIKRTGLLPEISFTTISSIAPSAATIQGTGLRGGMPTDYFVEYGGTSGNYTNTKPAETSSTGSNSDNVTFNLISLLPNTKYYYRLRATNDEGNSFVKEQSFTTTALASASTGVATEITAVSAKLDAVVDPNGVSTTAYFQWGTTTSFGSKTSDQVLTNDGDQPVFAVLTGLADNTVYYYRITATTSAGTVSGANGTFTTLKITTDTGSATELSTTSAKVDANVNPNGASAQVNFEYGLSTAFGSKTSEQTVSGFGDQTITASLTDLLEGNTYYYRIVAKTSAKTTTGSTAQFNTVTTAKKLSFGAITHAVDGANYKVSAALLDGDGIKTGKVYYRPIRSTNAFLFSDASPNGQKMDAIIPASELDEIGIECYITVKDATTGVEPVKSTNAYIYTPVTQAIPNLSSGGQPSNYRIISIPAALSNRDPRTVFNAAMIAFGGYNTESWRLMRYQPGEPQGQNIDFESITQIEAGKGYWFNSVDKVDIPVSGTAVEANQSSPFKMQLQKGWNQVGNPFTFNIPWSDIVEANDSPAALGNKFYAYDPTNESFKQATTIDAWSGGFVKATEAMTIDVPVTIQKAPGREYSPYEISSSDLGEPAWFLPLTIEHGDGANSLPGIGMHTDASTSNDRFDEQSLPRFINYLELNTIHREFFMPKFARDVVPVSANYQWDFIISSNFRGSNATLRWNSLALGDNNAKLILYDESAGELIDMKTNSSYTFDVKGSHSVTILYSVDERNFTPSFSGIGKPYPNPFRENVTIPFFTGKVSGNVQISVYDMTGRKVKTIVSAPFGQGLHQSTWDGCNDNGERMSAGIYIYRFSSADRKAITGRLVLN